MFPKVKPVIGKHWHTLQVNPEYSKIFHESPSIEFRRNKNIRQILARNIIVNHKKLKKLNNRPNSNWSPCSSNTRTLYCKQVIRTATLKSHQTKRTFDIFCDINCKSKYIIHLIDSNLCKIQYVWKLGTPFNIYRKNHWKDIEDLNALTADKPSTWQNWLNN